MSLAKVAVSAAVAAIGASIGRDVFKDIRERYRRAKLRKELAALRGETELCADELLELKRQLQGPRLDFGDRVVAEEE